MKKKILMSVCLAGALLFVGCGSSGGGDSTASDSSSLSFPTGAVVALPTLENGQKVEAVVATNQANGIPMLNSVQSNTQLNTALLSSKVASNIVKNIKNTKLHAYALNETIEESYDCSGGGHVSVNGSGTEFTNTTMNMTYSQCSEDGAITNGSMSAFMSNYDQNADTFKDMSVTFTSDYSMTNGSAMSTIAKNSSMSVNMLAFDSYAIPTNFRLAMSLQASDGTTSYGQKDCIYYFSMNGFESISMYQTQGRIYIDNLASYVDYDTSYDMSATPFVFSGYGITSGESRYKMSGSSNMKIKIESNQAVTYVDANGDGMYELRE